MAVQTTAAIRLVFVQLVAAITPTMHARDRFDLYREDDDLRAHARGHARGCFRKFSIRSRGDTRPPAVSNATQELVTQTFEVVVAYERSMRFGGEAQLDDVITEDLRLVRGTIGATGFPQSYPAHRDLCLVLSPTLDRIEMEPAVAFGVLELDVEFWRYAR